MAGYGQKCAGVLEDLSQSLIASMEGVSGSPPWLRAPILKSTTERFEQTMLFGEEVSHLDGSETLRGWQ